MVGGVVQGDKSGDGFQRIVLGLAQARVSVFAVFDQRLGRGAEIRWPIDDSGLRDLRLYCLYDHAPARRNDRRRTRRWLI